MEGSHKYPVKYKDHQKKSIITIQNSAEQA